jgi:hypothetical protein
MALTRKFLSALGIEAEKIDEIISSHTETVEGLKDEIKSTRMTPPDSQKLKRNSVKQRRSLKLLRLIQVVMTSRLSTLNLKRSTKSTRTRSKRKRLLKRKKSHSEKLLRMQASQKRDSMQL